MDSALYRVIMRLHNIGPSKPLGKCWHPLASIVSYDQLRRQKHREAEKKKIREENKPEKCQVEQKARRKVNVSISIKMQKRSGGNGSLLY